MYVIMQSIILFDVTSQSRPASEPDQCFNMLVVCGLTPPVNGCMAGSHIENSIGLHLTAQ